MLVVTSALQCHTGRPGLVRRAYVTSPPQCPFCLIIFLPSAPTFDLHKHTRAHVHALARVGRGGGGGGLCGIEAAEVAAEDVEEEAALRILWNGPAACVRMLGPRVDDSEDTTA